MKLRVNVERIVDGNELPASVGPVVYWMGRDQRAQDNWALLYAAEKAIEAKVPLYVFFCLVNEYLGAGLRQYDFMLKGLAECSQQLKLHGIPMFIRRGDPVDETANFLKETAAALLVMDFDPLRERREWQRKLMARLKIPCRVIDAHNIVPCAKASVKKEFGAYTLRPKLNKLLPHFLEAFPELPVFSEPPAEEANWKSLSDGLSIDRSIVPSQEFLPGTNEGMRRLRDFIDHQLENYPAQQADPTKDGLSRLSPWLHFGQISAQTAYLEILHSSASTKAKEDFLEQLFVRRELSDNFCYYEPNYDNVDAFPDWSKKNAALHRMDERNYLYTSDEFERAKTHDPLWNACQQQMLKSGTMHSYLRMYWAKKILEWTPSQEEALRIAIFLNNKYQLDGRDPNGYAGIQWCIGGVHDRAWSERPVFGKLRYMNENGCKRKFDVKSYIAQWS